MRAADATFFLSPSDDIRPRVTADAVSIDVRDGANVVTLRLPLDDPAAVVAWLGRLGVVVDECVEQVELLRAGVGA